MKPNLLIFILLLFACNLNVRAQNANNAVQLSDDFDRSQGRLIFIADNRDFCDYQLQITFLNVEGFSGMGGTTSVIVSPGEQQIRNYRVQEGAPRVSYNYRYAMFRGNPNKNPNIDFVYSLPVTENESVISKVIENREGYQLEFELLTDTIFASRSGVVCNDDLTDHTAKGYRGFGDNRNVSQITVYHNDGTFAEYIFRGKSLVYPGQNVEIGKAIAVFYQDMDRNTLRFSTYFLDKNKVRNTNIGNKHTHFRPFFQTAEEGKIRLANEGAYSAELTNEMRLQDMNRRERRRHLQNN